MFPLTRSSAAAWIALGLSVVSCAPHDGPAAAPADTTWRAFEGSWTAAGTRKALSLGPERPTSIIAVSGTVALSGAGRPGVAFRAEAIVLTDAVTGGVGRAAWTDERGDQVFSELSAQGRGGDRRIQGVFVGGTGRYAGLEGGYTFDWQYLLEAEDGTIQGRTQGLNGRYRLTGPRP